MTSRDITPPEDVKQRFDVERMAEEYLSWYSKILSDFKNQNK